MRNTPTFVFGENRLFREGLRSLLARTPYRVVGIGDSFRSIQRNERANAEPNLLLFGISVESNGWFDDLKESRTVFPDSRVVVLTSIPSQRHLGRCLEAGIDGYLLTDISRDVLLKSLRLIFLGEKVFPTILASWIVDEMRGGKRASPVVAGGPNLSPREREILQLLIQGESNKQIGRRLRIADTTVKIHVRKIMRKIEASNRTQAAVWAVNHGLAAPSPSPLGQETATDGKKLERLPAGKGR